jgi:hypothetical protein
MTTDLLFWRRAMTMRQLFFVFTLAFVLCVRAGTAEKGDLKSGPQPGDDLPGPFLSLVVHSGEPDLAGKRNDFSEQYGQNPVVLVFARKMTSHLTSLVKKLDAEVAERKSAKLRAVLVILSDDDALETNLKDYGKEQAIKHVNLAIMEPAGPKLYKLSKDADVTVVIYKRRKVEANHAFRDGELNEKGVEKILADVPKITSDQ